MNAATTGEAGAIEKDFAEIRLDYEKIIVTKHNKYSMDDRCRAARAVLLQRLFVVCRRRYLVRPSDPRKKYPVSAIFTKPLFCRFVLLKCDNPCGQAKACYESDKRAAELFRNPFYNEIKKGRK